MALRSTSPQRLDIRHFLTVKRTRSAIEVDLLMRDRHRLLLDPKLTVLLRLQRLLCGNSARNRGTARATALGRTSPFPGETGKVRCRRNPAVHHGIGEGRQPFPLRTLDGTRLAGVKIRKGSSPSFADGLQVSSYRRRAAYDVLPVSAATMISGIAWAGAAMISPHSTMVQHQTS